MEDGLVNLLLLEYIAHLKQSFIARDNGDIDLEDCILSELDALWLKMSRADRENSERLAIILLEMHQGRIQSALNATYYTCSNAIMYSSIGSSEYEFTMSPNIVSKGGVAGSNILTAMKIAA